MNKLLKDLINNLKKQPAVEEEDIEEVKKLFQYVNIKKRRYMVVGVYENCKCKSKEMSYKNIPYEVWYSTKYRKGRFIFLDGILLNYDLKDSQIKNLNNIKDLLIDKENVQFVLYQDTAKISEPD